MSIHIDTVLVSSLSTQMLDVQRASSQFAWAREIEQLKCFIFNDRLASTPSPHLAPKKKSRAPPKHQEKARDNLHQLPDLVTPPNGGLDADNERLITRQGSSRQLWRIFPRVANWPFTISPINYPPSAASCPTPQARLCKREMKQTGPVESKFKH